VIAAVWFVVYGEFWKVKNITVLGIKLADEASVISAGSAYIHSHGFPFNVLGQDNILFWIAAGKIRLDTVTEVSDASIKTKFDSRTVQITVNERSLKAAACSSSELSECYALDENGKVFARIPWIEGSIIPRFERESGEVVAEGARYFRNPEYFKNVLGTIKIMSSHGFTPANIIIREDNLEEWEASLDSGVIFYFSLNFIPDDFNDVLGSISRRIDTSNLSYFDFRVQNRVYYK